MTRSDLRRPILRLALHLGISIVLLAGPAVRHTPNLEASPPQFKLYLSSIVQQSASCDPSPEEQAVADLMINDPDQERETLTCNPILAQVASERAVDMGVREYFGHVNPDGYGPNYLVEHAGYLLPDYYDQSPIGNNIESIAAGYTSAAAVWEAWMGSEAHRVHLLGLTDFWEDQYEYGVGYAYVEGSPYGHYWVVLTALPGP